VYANRSLLGVPWRFALAMSEAGFEWRLSCPLPEADAGSAGQAWNTTGSTWHTCAGQARERRGRDATEALTAAAARRDRSHHGNPRAAALASGPAAPGKEVVQITCDGLGTISISVQRGENSNGAAQIVDAKGHGIPIDATLTLTDLTTSTVLGSEMTSTGHGNGHPNQPGTHCSGALFQGTASGFFGTDLPLGVAPTDTVQLTIDGFAIIKA
jgi:hypothetical protein